MFEIKTSNLQPRVIPEQESISIKPLAWLKAFIKDARNFQIVYLSLFLAYGLLVLGWDEHVEVYAAFILTSCAVQAIGIYFTHKKFIHVKSALITALGLCLLLHVNSISTAILAAALAIGAKYIIRLKGKHVFNPANLGIVLAIWLTQDAWVSPGQWGSSIVLLLFFGAAALIVLLKVGRIDTSLAFLGSYLGLQFIYSVLYLGWPMDFFTHQITNGTILLFAFFMITDPMTTPNHRFARIIWAVLIGIVAFSLTSVFHLHTAPIWTLFFFAPLTALLDRYFKAPKYEWLNKGTESTESLTSSN